MIEPIVSLSAEGQRLSLQVPYRQFEGTLDGEVPILEAGQRDTAATYGTHDRGSTSVLGEEFITGRVENALGRIRNLRPVVERLSIAKGIYAIEYRAIKPSLGSCRSRDRPTPGDSLRNSLNEVGGVVLIRQIPNVSGHKPMPDVKNRRASIATLTEGVLGKVVAVNRFAAGWAENIGAVVE